MPGLGYFLIDPRLIVVALPAGAIDHSAPQAQMVIQRAMYYHTSAPLSICDKRSEVGRVPSVRTRHRCWRSAQIDSVEVDTCFGLSIFCLALAGVPNSGQHILGRFEGARAHSTYVAMFLFRLVVPCVEY